MTTARLGRAARAGLLLAASCLAVAAGGCGTSHPRAIAATRARGSRDVPLLPRLLGRARRFDGHPLAAADGLKGYINTVGDSVYYGDCVQSKGIFGGGSCLLPLQVTTVIYRLHSNATLGPAAQHRRPRGARRPSTTKAARSRSTPAGWRSTSSPTTSPTRCAAAQRAASAERARLGRRAPARRRSTAPASRAPWTGS